MNQPTTTAASQKWRQQEGREWPDSTGTAATAHCVKFEEEVTFMGKTSVVNRLAGFSRLTFFALLVMIMAAATLHIGAVPAQAGQANLTWIAPTTNTNGTALSNLAGYKLHIGDSPRSYDQHIDVGKVTSYQASNLTDGSTYYFAISAYDTSGAESANSNEVSKIIPGGLPLSHLITATSGAGGKITALSNTKVNVATSGSTTLTSVTVTDGATQSFSIAAATGYMISGVTVDGASIGAVSSYTFSNVKANHSITASFKLKTTSTASYAITATAYANGSISPAGSSSVASGTSKTFAITPAAGYQVSYVKVDGVWVGAVTSYTFSNVTANHTIAVSFKLKTATTASYSITATAYANGSISPAGSSSVASGTSRTFAITPAAGYQVSSVRVDGVAVGAVTSYTFSNVTANHTIAVSFKLKSTVSYAITATAYANGSISPAGTTSVASGTSRTFAITPAAGYQVSSVRVDGLTVGAVTSYTFSNVTANHTIAVSFKLKTVASYAITATAYANGSISPAGTTTVASGTSKTFAITPATGYAVSAVKVNGLSIGSVTSYTFSNVKANGSIAVSFKLR